MLELGPDKPLKISSMLWSLLPDSSVLGDISYEVVEQRVLTLLSKEDVIKWRETSTSFYRGRGLTKINLHSGGPQKKHDCLLKNTTQIGTMFQIVDGISMQGTVTRFLERHWINRATSYFVGPLTENLSEELGKLYVLPKITALKLSTSEACLLNKSPIEYRN